MRRAAGIPVPDCRAPFNPYGDALYSMKLIYRAGDINEANIVAGMLRAHGIEAHVSGYYLQGGIGDLPPADFASVHVADEDIDAARALINEYENAPGS